ncbi:hypothetical protein BASA81_008547 [Batrachochytrium salamandrivorans]|nr:hypothetical protein BASA81_008547 [Batrachochytrium salamandrivorans]
MFSQELSSYKLRGNELWEFELSEVPLRLSYKTLASALQHGNNHVTELVLLENDLGNAGAKAVAKALVHSNCKVDKLILRAMRLLRTSLMREGGSSLKSLLYVLASVWICATNACPQFSSLVSTGLNSKIVNVLCEALISQNCGLVDLRLGSNLISNHGAVFLARALEHEHNKICRLDLEGNAVSSDLATNALAIALSCVHNKLESLK